MRALSIYRVEFKRLLFSKFVWLIFILSVFAPLFGYSLFKVCLSDLTMSAKYLANPVLAGTVIGGVLLAFLTILESENIYRTKTNMVIDPVVNPTCLVFSRTLAIITFSTITSLICGLVYLPFTMQILDYLFNFKLYAQSFLILMIPTWWISILLADAFYQITRGVEIASLLYFGSIYLCFSRYFDNDFFVRWINPMIYTYSDGFSNAFEVRISLYTRIIWLALSSGIYAFSLICIRKYQKNLVISFFYGIRKIYLSIISAVLVFIGAMLWINQPFVNHASKDFNYEIYDNHLKTSAVATDISYKITAEPSGTVHGTVEYTINKPYDYEDSENIWFNTGYKILNVTCNGEKISFETLNNHTNDMRQTTFKIPRGNKQKISLDYQGMPQISPCYLPSYWPNFSSFDYVSLTGASAVPRLTSFSMPESIEASLELTLSEKLTPVVDHKLLSEFTHNSNGTKTWKAKITKPTKLWITACDYALIEFTASDMDVQLIYSRKYDDNIKKYKIPEAVSSVIEYCTKHLGVLKFTSNNKLVMIERSSSGGDGGNAGNGWVEWSEYIFTENNLKNPLQGANANEVFAHEIVHLWWGTLSIMFPFHDDIWSDEGLTVYTTYRIMKERHGEDYAKKNYIDIWENAVNIQNRGYYYRHPEAIEKLPEQYRVQLKQSYNKTNKYCRMPLMILKAEKLLGGEKKFDKILQDIYKKYSESEEDFTYQNFLDECGLEKDDLNLA